MEARYFYFTVHSARDLIDVRLFGEMKVYAKVSIAGISKYTKVDLVNKTNPEWNTRFCFFVPEEAKDVPIYAVIELFCQRSFSEDKYVGHLYLILRPFNKEGGEFNFSVDRNDSNSNESFGTLKISVESGDKILLVRDSSSSSSSKNFCDIIEKLKTGLEVAKVGLDIVKNFSDIMN